MGFDPRWLEARFAFDAAAFHSGCFEAFEAQLAALPTKRIADMGAGLGANIRHLAPRLRGPQSWTLVDTDAAILEESITALAAWGTERGWHLEGRGETSVSFDCGGDSIEVETVCASLLEVERTVLSRVDAVTANAVFDLLTAAELEAFVGTLARCGLPLFATLNYTGMALSPSTPQDLSWIEAYESHMRRSRGGRALGPDCARALLAQLGAQGFATTSGPSQWKISGRDQQMVTHLLDFMQGSVPQVLSGASARAGFESWLRARRGSTAKRQLSATVDHLDIFASPG